MSAERPQPSAEPRLDIDDALATLDLSRPVSWPEIREAFRHRIRSAHPDVAGDSATSTRRSAELNHAFEVLETATNRGATPLPPPYVGSRATGSVRSSGAGSGVTMPTPENDPDVVVLSAPTGDVFINLLDAAYLFGDVSYVSAEEGLLQVLVSPDHGPRYQLLISLDESHTPAHVAFALDSMTTEPGPPIASVVAEFSEILGRTA